MLLLVQDVLVDLGSEKEKAGMRRSHLSTGQVPLY